MATFEAGDDVHEGMDPDAEGGDGGGGVGGAFVEVELVEEFVEGFGVTLHGGNNGELVSGRHISGYRDDGEHQYSMRATLIGPLSFDIGEECIWPPARLSFLAFGVFARP